jgi:hypothetical protein
MAPLWRRRPLHEKLLDAQGLELGGPAGLPPGHPFGDLVGVHGLARVREWDTVVTAESEPLTGDEVNFAALPDGTLIVDEDVPDDSLAPLAEAVEGALDPPYRAQAVRKSDRVWAVGAVSIEVAELPGTAGDALDLAVQAGGRTLAVDGEAAFGGVPALERIAGARFEEYVARAERLDGDVFEIRVAPL